MTSRQTADTSTLTLKQSRFVREFLVDLNATQAAIRAGYSEKTARQAGSRLLTNADIQAEVQRLARERQQNVELTAEKVLEVLMRIAFAPIAQEDIKPSDALRALELLAKHLNLLTERAHVASDSDFIAMVQQVREKLAAGETVSDDDLLDERSWRWMLPCSLDLQSDARELFRPIAHN